MQLVLYLGYLQPQFLLTEQRIHDKYWQFLRELDPKFSSIRGNQCVVAMLKCVGERSQGMPHDLTMTAHPEHGETSVLAAACVAGARCSHTKLQGKDLPPATTSNRLMTHQPVFFCPLYIYIYIYIYILTCFDTFI
jgi:hypothetical protein